MDKTSMLIMGEDQGHEARWQWHLNSVMGRAKVCKSSLGGAHSHPLVGPTRLRARSELCDRTSSDRSKSRDQNVLMASVWVAMHFERT